MRRARKDGSDQGSDGAQPADEGADQCGFCNTGLALTIIALRSELKNPTDEEIKHFVVGNLCRCTGYQAQFKAIKRYLEAHK